MPCIMDKNEVITLSSDDESDFTHRFEYKLNSSTTIKPLSKNSSENLKAYLGNLNRVSMIDYKVIKLKNNVIKNNKGEVKTIQFAKVSEKKSKYSQDSPELVDLVDCMEKTSDSDQIQCNNNESDKTVQNHSKLDVICIDEIPLGNDSSSKNKSDILPVTTDTEKGETKIVHEIQTESVEIKKESIITNVVHDVSKPFKNSTEVEGCHTEIKLDKRNKGSNQNLEFFTEFVEFCGFLEKIPNDRARLTKKLMKKYGEADYNYIKSEEFRNIIQKCRDKVNVYNLYLVAKEITDELSYRKENKILTKKSNQDEKAEEKPQRYYSTVGKNEKVQQNTGEGSKNRINFINKIVKKLDKLGNKIRQLEGTEVDLSDEEESAYVQLQRYRERFCQIYTKLCKYTNDVADAERFYSRKICFTESKYPVINKCIENWLNKTKRFPDFSDTMKLLESQSSSLGLPSNRESIRAIAIEIFQQVGAMLQRRRIYDLWDSFCGFLDDAEDPASTDSALEEALKSNFEARIKKEQEILQYFVELQEKERLEPEEVPDEEANQSPVDSENEDYKEIESIENFLNKKLDDVIEKETEEDGNTLGNNAWDGDGNNSENKSEPDQSLKLQNIKSKESKNNFRNCKSLKWRLESGGKSTSTSVNSEDSNAGTENEKERKTENIESDIDEITIPNNLESKKEFEKSGENKKKDTYLETLKNVTLDTEENHNKIPIKTTGCFVSPLKRVLTTKDKDENLISKKKKCSNSSKNEGDFDLFDVDNEKEDLSDKINKVFNVHYCQIFATNSFENINKKEKDWGKKKVFRDLTNVNRLFELHGKRKKMSGLYSPLFFHRSFCSFEKSSWQKRSRASFRFVGSKNQKCALNQEEKPGKKVNSGGYADKKRIQNNSESKRNGEGESFFNGRGNGNEEDNNEDKNKKNGRSGEEANENHFEEDEDEEENETEKDDNKVDTETAEYSFPKNKTEKPSHRNMGNKTPSDNQNNRSENVESARLSSVQSDSSTSDSKSENKNVKEDEEKLGEKTLLIKDQKENRRKKRRSKKKTYKPKIKKVPESKNGSDKRNEKNKDEKKHMEMTCTESEIEIVEHNSKIVAEKDAKKIEKEDNVEIKKEKTVEIEGSNSVSEKTEKESENPDSKTKSQSNSQGFKEIRNENKPTSGRKRNKNSCSEAAEELEKKRRTGNTLKKKESTRAEENKSTNIRNTVQLDLINQKFPKKNTPSTSDEERVKRFLMYSPSSISITPPKKLSLSKPPSQAALQALATLRNLKGISTTLVKGKPKKEDDVVVIGGSYKTHTNTNSSLTKCRESLPVISNVQSVYSTTPKIVTVQGNVSGFEYSWPEGSNSLNLEHDSSSIRISNVWGSLPDNFMQSDQSNKSFTPGCSSQQSTPGPSNPFNTKKSTKKTVEYVVLE